MVRLPDRSAPTLSAALQTYEARRRVLRSLSAARKGTVSRQKKSVAEVIGDSFTSEDQVA